MILSYLMAIIVLATCQEESDILSAHGGIFRVLEWTEFELAKISAYHATAEHHKLMEIIRDKLNNSNIDSESRKKIEKFLRSHRPPKFLETFLSEDDRDSLLKHHLQGHQRSYGMLMFDRLFNLTREKTMAALRYFGHHEQADILENAECYQCQVSQMAEQISTG
uniref:Inhibitor_I29 domain-containing protein n=1 Tax=Heterorhabditis bacteriophora TaxID=37862 RepID=A0A1I7X9J4_HETBA